MGKVRAFGVIGTVSRGPFVVVRLCHAGLALRTRNCQQVTGSAAEIRRIHEILKLPGRARCLIYVFNRPMKR
jgi:hypothetical protein